MTFHILTIFPDLIRFYFEDSILKIAHEKGLVDFKIYNIRDFSQYPHKKVDDKPYSGGPGMVLQIEPIFRCLQSIFGNDFYKNLGQLKKENKIILLTSPKGKTFNQKVAMNLSNYREIVLICGRYEGVDERVAKYLVHEESSIGNFILSGGELASLIIIESLSRLIPGVLGNISSLKEESFSIKGDDSISEYPQYTRPEKFSPAKNIKWSVPKILLSGHHKKIEEWKEKKAKY